ncbi:unnamed protein product [Leuciscus chuanchicus]
MNLIAESAGGTNMTSINTANINFKWDPKSLEIRTLAVERLLEPLVTQVTTLVNSSNKGPSNKKKGRSKKAHVLAASVETATLNFLEKGEKIAKESQFLKDELTAAVEDVRKQGDSMKMASGEFAEDPCSSVKRGNMVRAARALLSAVTHLLVLADMADVYQLLLQLKLVEESLVKVRNAGTEQDLGIQYKALKPEVDRLNVMAAKRQQKQIIVDPLNFSEERFRPSLEERLESIISGAALMADSSCTRDDRRERIVAECNSVRQALQDLLSEYMGNVINAALALAAKPNSKVAQDNMDLFKDQWEKQVRVLTDAVDDITSIDDFLCVSENHILEDVNKCVIALQEKDVDGLDRTAGAIRGRAARVVHVVTSEMDNYEPGVYTEKVLEATKLLTDTVMPRFTEQVEAAVEALSANPGQPMDENEFIDASRLVYDGVRDIRKAVLMIRTPEELDDSDFETDDFDSRSRTSVQTEDDQLIAGQSARAIMAQLPQEQKAKIAEQVASFQEEKSKLDAEVSKWDDSGNDIIVLAKQMCMIMMEMTDFTRGKGPLKNTSDVISAAKKIAEAGSRMDKLGRAIADQVDSAMSLIQAAKNLMNSVVSTVKASYVASTKYQKSQGMQNLNMPAISWRMKAPEKKPLVKREKQDDGQTNKVKRSSQKKHINPVQALSEFKAMDSI